MKVALCTSPPLAKTFRPAPYASKDARIWSADGYGPVVERFMDLVKLNLEQLGVVSVNGVLDTRLCG